MRAFKAVGTLVIPIFGFYYVTMANSGMLLYTIRHLFIRGKAKNHVFGSKVLSFSVVALRLNFAQPRAQSFLGFCTVKDDSCSLCNNFYN